MNWILLVILSIITIVNYLINGRLFLFPSVLASAMFTLSALFLVCNPGWQYNISIGTVLYISFALILFSIGVRFGGRLVRPDRKQTLSNYSYDINKHTMFILSLACIAVSLLYARHQYSVSLSLGNNMGWVGVIFTLRNAIKTNPEVFDLSTSLNMGISFARAVAIISLFLLISCIIDKDKQWRKYLIPVICFIVNIVFSTGRGGLICLVSVVIFDIYIIAHSRNKPKLNKSIIRYSLIGLSIFAGLFLILGVLTGKSEALSVSDTFSIYIGSSILCLDTLLRNLVSHSTPFACHSFKGIYNFLGRIFPGVPTLSNHEDMVYWSDYGSNVYSSLAPYLRDFGVFWSFPFLVLVGIIFGFFWRKVVLSRNLSVLVVSYGRFMGYALCMFSIAERLFSEFISLNVLCEIFFYCIILKFFLKKRVKAIPSYEQKSLVP